MKKRKEQSKVYCEVMLKRTYEAVTKYGDTLEISESGKKMGEHPGKNDLSIPDKKIISDSGERS